VIFRLGFDHREDAAAFRVWCSESGLAAIDTADRPGCPYPSNRILEVVVTGDADAFFDLWRPLIMSVGK
jgi:hypothetical protein